jgi:ABC-type amino acid transport substrate-binding protein
MPRFLTRAAVLLVTVASLSAGPNPARARTTATEDGRAVAIARIEVSGTQDVAERLLEAVYQRADARLQVLSLPAPRANAMSRRGEVDGELARIDRYFDENPQLIRVQPPLMWTDATVFMRADRAVPMSRVTDLDSLRIGVVRGVRQSQEAVEGARTVVQVTDAQQLYRMLSRGRLDAVVDSRVSKQRITTELGIHDVREVGVLSRKPVYHGLQARHTELAQRIGRTISAMRGSGELAALEAEAMAEASRPRSAPGAQ